MDKTTVIFLGSKPVGYRCLEAMLARTSDLKLEVVALMTQPRKEFGGLYDLAALAEAHGIPILEDADTLPACDFLMSVQYHRILSPAQLALARRMAVNLHMAPLPEYRGSNQFSHAILDGRKEFGTTLHLMDAHIDHGPVLAQRRWKIPEGVWVEDLYARTVEESVALFTEVLPSLISDDLVPVPQAPLEALHGTALHFRKGMDALKTLDLSWPAEKLERHLRATYMPGFEPPHAIVEGRKVYFVPEATA